LSGQRQQVLVAGHQQIGISALGQIEQGLILGVPARNGAFVRWIEAFAVGNVLRQ